MQPLSAVVWQLLAWLNPVVIPGLCAGTCCAVLRGSLCMYALYWSIQLQSYKCVSINLHYFTLLYLCWVTKVSNWTMTKCKLTCLWRGSWWASRWDIHQSPCERRSANSPEIPRQRVSTQILHKFQKRKQIRCRVTMTKWNKLQWKSLKNHQLG